MQPEQKTTMFHGGVLSAMGHRDYRLLWSGAFLSNVGTWIQTAALLWFVNELTHSNTWVGAVNLMNFVPVFLFVLYAGSLADHLDRKKLILVGQTVMMLGAFALAACAQFGVATKWVILLIVGIMGVAFAFNFPAWQSILPDLVPRRDMLNAIALSSAQYNLARFLGGGLGAIILAAWSSAGAFFINGVSFLLVIAAVLMVRTETPGYPHPPDGVLHHVREGLDYILERSWMAWLLVSVSIASFFGFSYIVLMPSVTQNVLHRGSVAYGVLLGLTGLGAVVGAPLVTYLNNRRLEERNVIKLCMVGLGLFLLGFGLSRIFWVTCIMAFGLGISFLMMSATVNTLLQSASTREIRGRVISFYIMMVIGVFPIGGQVMGYVSDVRSTSFALLVDAVVVLALGAFLIIFPGFITPKPLVGAAPPGDELVGDGSGASGS